MEIQMTAMAEPSASRTVTIEEACRRLGLGRTTGYALAQTGQFPARAFKVGRLWRVSTRSLDRLIEGDEADQDTA